MLSRANFVDSNQTVSRKEKNVTLEIKCICLLDFMTEKCRGKAHPLAEENPTTIFLTTEVII